MISFEDYLKVINPTGYETLHERYEETMAMIDILNQYDEPKTPLEISEDIYNMSNRPFPYSTYQFVGSLLRKLEKFDLVEAVPYAKTYIIEDSFKTISKTVSGITWTARIPVKNETKTSIAYKWQIKKESD